MDGPSEDRAELLFHPVRMRILQALLRSERLTPRELGSSMPDVPPATLYRQLNRLADAGLVRVVDERPVRGVVERVFAVVLPSLSLGADDLGGASPSDHLRYFTVFTAGLLEQFRSYVEGGDVDLARDRAGYRQFPMNLSDPELDELLAAIDALLRRAMANEPRPDRKRRVLTRILIPSARAEDDDDR